MSRGSMHPVGATLREGDPLAGGRTYTTTSPAEAAARLGRSGVEAMAYTTPSHTPERPRWRAILPLRDPVALAAGAGADEPFLVLQLAHQIAVLDDDREGGAP